MLCMVEHFTATSPSSSFRSLGGRLFEKWDSSGQILFFICFRPAFQFYSWWAGLGVVIRGSWEGYLSLAAPHSWSRSYTLTNLKNRKYSGDWTIYPLIRMIRKKQSEFSEVHWNWVPREANSAAASREVGLQCWVDRPPPSLLRVLTADGLPGPPTHLGLSFYFCEVFLSHWGFSLWATLFVSARFSSYASVYLLLIGSCGPVHEILVLLLWAFGPAVLFSWPSGLLWNPSIDQSPSVPLSS